MKEEKPVRKLAIQQPRIPNLLNTEHLIFLSGQEHTGKFDLTPKQEMVSGQPHNAEEVTISDEVADNEKRAMELLVANKKLEHLNQMRLKEISDYKHVLDESSILAITDLRGTIIYVNEYFCKLCQHQADELIGQDHRMLNSSYHSGEYMDDLWSTISAGRTWRGELRNLAKDGSCFWISTTIIPFLDAHGKPYQYAALSTDMTPKKKAEEELRLVYNEIEVRVKERTEDLEAFSYSVSHDLRAPLRAVSGYAKMFKTRFEGQIDSEGDRLLNNIVDNATRMGVLIDDLLTFSRIGRREMKRTHVSMKEMVTNICLEQNNDRVKKIDFRIGDLPETSADSTGVKQVWQNLLTNAVKYTSQKDTAIVEIGSETNGGIVTYHVKDNGAGFDMRYVGKLFNIFQRLHSDAEFAGTGVGLAIVQRIIHKHSGRVWAEGKVGEGAQFYFTVHKS